MLIIIEGNIGVGKSTLAHQLADQNDFRLFEEGADTNQQFKKYLELYYQDPSRYALEMQFWLLSTRFKQHQEALQHIHQTGQCCIMDRSIYGDTVFAKRNFLDGNISELGYDSYLKHRDMMLRYLMVPQLTIFLDAKPEVCLERVKSRARNSESDIPLDYLNGINSLYMELLDELKTRGSQIRLLDWNKFQPLSKLDSIIDEFTSDFRWSGYINPNSTKNPNRPSIT